VATGYGLNRNMGCNTMTDKEYRQHVEQMFHYNDYKKRMVWLALNNDHGLGFRYRVWLQVMGLIETWDMTR